MAETFNLYEAILWFVIAVALFSTAIFDKSKKLYKTNLIISAILFFAFGISDLIEMQTGAWWRPVGLLMLKSSCIIGFAFCFLKYRQLSKNKGDILDQKQQQKA